MLPGNHALTAVYTSNERNCPGLCTTVSGIHFRLLAYDIMAFYGYNQEHVYD